MSQMRQSADQNSTSETAAFESWLADLARHEHDGEQQAIALSDDTDDIARQVDDKVDLPALFLQRAAGAGCAVTDARSGDWRTVVVDILAARDAKKVLLDEMLPAGDRETLVAGLGGVGTSVTLAPDDDELFAVDAAITGVAAAIAETGTLIWTSGPTTARTATLVPPMHIAVVRAGQLMPDLCDYFATLGGDMAIPANVNLITGPSKTADIEGILITGVHGPGTVHVVLAD